MNESFSGHATVLVTGKSTIDHTRRVALNMGLLHYVLMSYCLKLEGGARPIKEVDLWVELGIKSRQFQKAADWLVSNDFLKICQFDAKPVSTGKHRLSGTTAKSVDELFESFWKATTIGDKKYSFTGSKQDARNKFKYALDDVGFDYLMDQKLWYFRLVSEKPDRPILMGATFLSKTSRRYTEDFKSQCKRIHQVLPEANVKKLTAEEMKNLFEEEA